METATTTGRKPAESAPGLVSPPTAQVAGNLLTRKDFGLHVTGRVDAVSEVQHREGKSEKGKEWSFWQQTVSVTVGGQLFEVAFRSDTNPSGPLCPYELDDMVKIKVDSPRMYNGKLSFDAAK